VDTSLSATVKYRGFHVNPITATNVTSVTMRILKFSVTDKRLQYVEVFDKRLDTFALAFPGVEAVITKTVSIYATSCITVEFSFLREYKRTLEMQPMCMFPGFTFCWGISGSISGA
jgi:hypothetical protein